MVYISNFIQIQYPIELIFVATMVDLLIKQSIFYLSITVTLKLTIKEIIATLPNRLTLFYI